MLIAISICGLLLTLVAVEFHRYRRERAAIDRLADGKSLGRDAIAYGFAQLRESAQAELRFSSVRPLNLVVGRSRAWFGLKRRVFLVAVKGMWTEDDFHALAELQSLCVLVIIEATLTRGELQAIARLSSLQWLKLVDCELNCDDLQPLAQLALLERLKLRNTDVPEAALLELQEALPELEVQDD